MILKAISIGILLVTSTANGDELVDFYRSVIGADVRPSDFTNPKSGDIAFCKSMFGEYVCVYTGDGWADFKQMKKMMKNKGLL